ncbi:TPM domain-containing protein [Aquimarina sp. TRL1]|uniref:TPM domain-containing protein n=1 Tax=Aquimarina sp. (strain TRL1) TaxID=2736252 RepID=UPI00158CB537|nr:TPM domain-containing protein [Aquimarina sp. TRL1]QKX03948.1 TPM domain-containing protein [Aquimarina sp. TRL1]
MSKVEDFLSADEEQKIVAAIRTAEKTTSGEIRVHLEKSTDKDSFERAREVFHYLKMDNTIQRNGVLIYIAVEDRQFVIYGDQGINDVVADNFWEQTKDRILSQFKQEKYAQGIIDGVLLAGEQLQHYFPWDHNDTNELSDEISKG